MPAEHLRRCSIDDTKEVEMIGGSPRRVSRTLAGRRVRHVLFLLAVSALVGSIAGGSARTASADTSPNATPASFVRACADPAPGELACFALRRTTGVIANMPAGMSPAAAAAAVSGFGPADLIAAYKLPTGLGAGRTVGDRRCTGRSNAESDLATYRTQFGLPPCTTANGCFRKINQNGGTSPLPAPNTGWAGEIMLDIEMVSAVCPQCKILLVEATSADLGNLGTAVNQAVTQGAIAVSNSYGGSESSSDPTASTTYYRHPGWSRSPSPPATRRTASSSRRARRSSPRSAARGSAERATRAAGRRPRGQPTPPKAPVAAARASRRSRRSRPTPAARAERSPSIRGCRSGDRRGRSTTPTAQAAGRCSVARASRRRSSAPSTRLRRRRRRAPSANQ